MCPDLAHAGETTAKGEVVNRLVFTVRLNSLQPSAVTVPEGTYEIELSTGILRDSVSFELSGPAKAKLAAAKTKAHRARESVVVRLTAGDYVLQVAGYSKWTSKIIVTSKKQ
jgi:hypothetical protein